MKIMKMHNHFLKKMKNISENEFLNFYFLNVDISINMHDLGLKLYRCIQYIAVEGTVSQNFYTGLSPIFFFNLEINIQIKNKKVARFST